MLESIEEMIQFLVVAFEAEVIEKMPGPDAEGNQAWMVIRIEIVSEEELAKRAVNQGK